MPTKREALDIEKLIEDLDSAIVGRAHFSDMMVDWDEKSSEDSSEISKLDSEILETCRQICPHTPSQTEVGLLDVALRQLERKKKISQRASSDILAALRSDLKS